MKTLQIKLPNTGENDRPVTIPVTTSADAWSWPKTRDLIQGGITAALTSALFLIQQYLAAGQFKFDWQEVGMAALAGIGAYILRKLPQQKVIVINPKELLP